MNNNSKKKVENLGKNQNIPSPQKSTRKSRKKAGTESANKKSQVKQNEKDANKHVESENQNNSRIDKTHLNIFATAKNTVDITTPNNDIEKEQEETIESEHLSRFDEESTEQKALTNNYNSTKSGNSTAEGSDQVTINDIIIDSVHASVKSMEIDADSTREKDSTLIGKFAKRLQNLNELLKTLAYIIPAIILGLTVAKMYLYSDYYGVPVDDLNGLTVLYGVTINLLLVGSLIVYLFFHLWYITPQKTLYNKRETEAKGIIGILASFEDRIINAFPFIFVFLIEALIVWAYIDSREGLISIFSDEKTHNVYFKLFVLLCVAHFITTIEARIAFQKSKKRIVTATLYYASTFIVFLVFTLPCMFTFFAQITNTIYIRQRNAVQETVIIDGQKYVTVCHDSNRKLVVKCDEIVINDDESLLVIYKGLYRYIDPKDYMFSLIAYDYVISDDKWYLNVDEQEGTLNVTVDFTNRLNGKYTDNSNYYVEFTNNDEKQVTIGNYYNLEVYQLGQWRYYSSKEAILSSEQPIDLNPGCSKVCSYNLSSFGKLIPGIYRIACGDDGTGTNYYYVEFSINEDGEFESSILDDHPAIFTFKSLATYIPNTDSLTFE